MDDKMIMTTILGNVKGACDLMMHGSIESVTPDVTCTFKTALNDTLEMQKQIYDKMSQKGWYPVQQVEQQKIDQARQQFSAQ